ncbi:MAG: nicotinamide riboside transporter PnuC [Opitutales bacterium]
MLQEIGSQLVTVPPAEWFGMLTGVSGVYLSIKEKLLAWPLFILCYATYVYLSWEAALFATLLLNTVFIFISLYGWSNWLKASQSSKPQVHIQQTPRKLLLRCGLVIACFSLFLGGLLDRYSEAYLPYLDAFATSCAFIAQWMLSRKYIENWIFWIVADCIFVGLWAAQEYYVSATLFIMFIALATKGWREWNTTLQAQNA